MSEEKEPAFVKQAEANGNSNGNTQAVKNQGETQVTAKTYGIIGSCKSIDNRFAFESELPEHDLIWDGFEAGTVGSIIGAGGVGKSYWTLEAAMAVACETDKGNILNININKHGTVLYISAEDTELTTMKRMQSIGKLIKPEARESIINNLDIKPMVGLRLNVMEEEHINNIIDYGKGKRLIVIDTLSRVHVIDENSNSDMARLITNLEHIARNTGASILFLHHANKSSILNGQVKEQTSGRGASVLTDNVRYKAFLEKMTVEDVKELKLDITEEKRLTFLKFGVNKRAIGAYGAVTWYWQVAEGVILPIDINLIKEKIDQVRQGGNNGENYTNWR